MMEGRATEKTDDVQMEIKDLGVGERCREVTAELTDTISAREAVTKTLEMKQHTYCAYSVCKSIVSTKQTASLALLCLVPFTSLVNESLSNPL